VMNNMNKKGMQVRKAELTRWYAMLVWQMLSSMMSMHAVLAAAHGAMCWCDGKLHGIMVCMYVVTCGSR
jgi:hypothetical protein